MINRKKVIIVLLCLLIGMGLGLLVRTQVKKSSSHEIGQIDQAKKTEKADILPLPANTQAIPPEKRPGDFSRALPSKAIMSKPWEQNLKKALYRQGGAALVDAQFTVVDSFVWKKDGIPLRVESLIITLKNKNKSEVRFRALIDSQSGSIIETWDRPIVDPANTRAVPGIKIDPRYHSEN